MEQGLIKKETLTAIGNAIREKNNSILTYTPSQMPDAIKAIQGGFMPDVKDLTYTGNCNNLFRDNNFNWVINNYGKNMKVSMGSNLEEMFKGSTNLIEIPFEIQGQGSIPVGQKGWQYSSTISMFEDCHNLRSIPSMKELIFISGDNMFKNCWKLQEIPDDIDTYFDYRSEDSLVSQHKEYGFNNIFNNCRSLRKLPYNFLKHANKGSSPLYTYFNFYQCFSLDEIVMYLPFTTKFNINCFNYNQPQNAFTGCFRVKDIQFEPNKIMDWSNQTVDLGLYVGYVGGFSNFDANNFNDTVAKNHRIIDDETYNLYKNDPDAWTDNVRYSRYNHDSAVHTINSLPKILDDGTLRGDNTIIFNGLSGEKTDGGAISKLTQDEIAVATAKGWKVQIQ